MVWHVMPDFDAHETARAEFEWDLPSNYNPALDCLRKHEAPSPADRLALIDAGTDERYTYRDLDDASGWLASALANRGIEPGDRVAVLAPQRAETLIAHFAAWKLGAVTVPLTTLFGEDALAYRLDDADVRAVLFDPTARDALAAASGDCPALDLAVALPERPWYVGEPTVGDDSNADFACDVVGYDAFVADRAAAIAVHESTPGTDSAIMYTSGSTGPPKGVRHRHAMWTGRAAAAHTVFEGNLGADTVAWTPSDWAWGSALGMLTLGTLHHGGTVVAAPMEGFDPTAALDLVETYEVTEALIAPTALRMLMNDDPIDDDLPLRAVAAAGEPLTSEILEWAEKALDGVPINEYYGQTELNLVVGNSSRWFETKAGSMGKPLPGYDVTILDPDTGEELPTGEVGEIAVRPHDERVFFAEYWNRPAATAAKRHGEWYLTDDLARMDEEGYLWFESRADDVIITSGYRVGPMEVEEALLDHQAVEQVGVVGVLDDTRGEIIKAFAVTAAGVEGDGKLREELRERAREKLAAYEYPREIEFVEALPMTSSGKIRRVALRERESRE